jgi:hypothetical protein
MSKLEDGIGELVFDAMVAYRKSPIDAKTKYFILEKRDQATQAILALIVAECEELKYTKVNKMFPLKEDYCEYEQGWNEALTDLRARLEK